jgi:hypothetical protein
MAGRKGGRVRGGGISLARECVSEVKGRLWQAMAGVWRLFLKDVLLPVT